MAWMANGESHGYSFSYDGADRLLEAVHGNNYFTEKVTSYDKNGNIKGLQRYGQLSSSTYGLVDDLTFTLNGNRLVQVEDAVTAVSYTGGTNFINGSNSAEEYAYDKNGNLTKDLNKNITNISYNYLNLPLTVNFTDGSMISYLYSADGNKLRTTHVINGITTQTDYCGNVLYENGVQKRMITEEGYIDLTVSTPTYYYYLKDHQGNNRVVINSSGTVQETNHYYPFGGLFANNSSIQPYKYNGKEFDSKMGLNWYDYGARQYDATLGRWHVVDPMAEKMYEWSPYTYCFNNPIRWIDKNGEIPGPGDLFKTKRDAAKDWGMYYNGASILRKREFGSTIYKVKGTDGTIKGYSYTEPNEGEHSVILSTPKNGEEIVGLIHSHGDADKNHKNNDFSANDIKATKKINLNSYLATPSGTLLEYNPKTEKKSIVTNQLPSDPKDPQRVNKVEPIDIPKKKGNQQMEELHQRPNIDISVRKKELIHWFH